jgi:hypothetical protein
MPVIDGPVATVIEIRIRPGVVLPGCLGHVDDRPRAPEVE